MSKKKVTLEEAKQILDTDKIFYNGKEKFNYVYSGKYRPGITIEIPQEWTLNKKRHPECPIQFIECKELTDGMNIDFDGDVDILLGNYRVSKNGRPVFELTKPTEARETLIRVYWGGAFNSTRGQHRSYAEEVGATYFLRKSSNGGGLGYDYWVLPVEYVNDMEPRDVSDILENIEEQENKRIEEIDEFIEKDDKEIKESINNKQSILSQIEPVIQDLKTYKPDFSYEAQEITFYYRESKNGITYTERYTKSLVDKISGLLEKTKEQKNARDMYKPMYEGMEDIVKLLNMKIIYYDTNINICKKESNSFGELYRYSQEDYNSFVNYLTECQEKIEKEKEEARIKAEELRKAAELKVKKEEAKEMGYPEKFEFWNRIGGATGLSHAYVIESDGLIREPDYNNLRNPNHRHHSNWLNTADGTQGYEQLLPGEIIVTYQKGCTKYPYIFGVEWADNEITEEQLEVICELLEDKSDFAEDNKEQMITDVQEWVTNATKEKSVECRKKLKLNEVEKDTEFVDDILKLAEEESELEEKNKEANILLQAYEKSQKSQQLIGDE